MYINNDMSTKGNSDFRKKNEKTIVKCRNRNFKYRVERIFAPIAPAFYRGLWEKIEKAAEFCGFLTPSVTALPCHLPRRWRLETSTRQVLNEVKRTRWNYGSK